MILSYIPSYLTQVLKVKETTGLLIISITMALMIPLALYFGKLSDKIGNKRVVQIGFTWFNCICHSSIFTNR